MIFQFEPSAFINWYISMKRNKYYLVIGDTACVGKAGQVILFVYMFSKL